jgi:hypothetical protein
VPGRALVAGVDVRDGVVVAEVPRGICPYTSRRLVDREVWCPIISGLCGMHFAAVRNSIILAAVSRPGIGWRDRG